MSGLAVATAKRTHRAIVEAIRDALADRITAAPGELRLHIGEPVNGFTLLTDSSIVTFDADVAAAITGELALPAALFATRDYGYRRGKRVSRGWLTPFNKWKRLPRRASNAEDVWRAIAGAAHKNPFESALWPQPYAVETRPGTTLYLTRAKTTFQPRDTAANQAIARTHRDENMIGNVRAPKNEQGPDDGPCATLKAWRPEHLDASADAIFAVVTDPALRTEQWWRLLHEIYSHDLVLDVQTARTLEVLRGQPRNPVEEAVAYLCSRLLGQTATLSEAARFDAVRTAYRHGRLDLVRDLDVVALARANLATKSHYASAAACILAMHSENLDAIGARAQSDRNFAISIGVHGDTEPPDTAAMLRVLDQVQPHVAVTGDSTDGYVHAHALWLTWFRRHTKARKADVDSKDRIARRIDLAEQLAPDHAATQQNVRVVQKLK